MNQKISKKEQILKWWQVEGKIECGVAIIALILLLVFWRNPLVEGSIGIFAALWGYGKIYFRRNQWALLLLVSTWVLTQSISILHHALK